MAAEENSDLWALVLDFRRLRESEEQPGHLGTAEPVRRGARGDAVQVSAAAKRELREARKACRARARLAAAHRLNVGADEPDAVVAIIELAERAGDWPSWRNENGRVNAARELIDEAMRKTRAAGNVEVAALHAIDHPQRAGMDPVGCNVQPDEICALIDAWMPPRTIGRVV